MTEFAVGPAPHDVAPNSVGRVMRIVLYTLLPAIVMHWVLFGLGLLVHIVLAALTAVASEALALRLRRRPLRLFLSDGSAIVTAVLLALALPPLAPWWLTVTATVFAILLAKHLFGGIGFNPFNPAMVGYAIMLVSFPVQMTQWLEPNAPSLSVAATLQTIFTGNAPATASWDALTGPTALSEWRSGLMLGQTMSELRANPVFGRYGAHHWEWVSLAALLGGIVLLMQRIIRWHIPVAMLATLAVCAATMHAADPGAYPGAVFHLMSGASMLGAFFIATDPITAATSDRGRLVYGAGIGALTYIIRTWGTYPDGVAFAVLLMNLTVPLIDRLTIPRIYGHPR